MKVILSLASAVMLLLASFSVASAADPVPGWNGEVKIHEGSGEPDPVSRDEPKVCTFHLHASGFDSEEQVDWWIIAGEPFDTLPVLEDTVATDANGDYVSEVFDLPVEHYKLFWAGEEAGGAKHKVFKVDCEPEPTPTPSPTPTPTPEATPTPTPEATPTPTPPSVEPTPVDEPTPDMTLPPTDTASGQPTIPTGSALLLVLMAAVGTAFAVLKFRE